MPVKKSMAQQTAGVQARLTKVAQILLACGDHVDKKRKQAVQQLDELYKNHAVSNTDSSCLSVFKYKAKDLCFRFSQR